MADQRCVDARTDSRNDADGLVAQAGRQLRPLHIVAVIVHTFGAIEAYGLDLERDLACAGPAIGDILEAQNFWAAKSVKADCSRHIPLLPSTTS